MTSAPNVGLRSQAILPWLAAAMAGIAGPCLALLILADAPAFGMLVGPVLAVGIMGAGMIAASVKGRLSTGVPFALVTGAGLLLLARGLGMPSLRLPLETGLAMTVAGCSFAARGALFARSAAARGWWIAVAVVAGEAAVVGTAAASPGSLPDWLLALLPAQWASAAIRTALAGTGAAYSELLALAGTAAATLLVARLWPRRWPYLVMFGTWLALSALVWQHPATATTEPVPCKTSPRPGAGSAEPSLQNQPRSQCGLTDGTKEAVASFTAARRFERPLGSGSVNGS